MPGRSSLGLPFALGQASLEQESQQGFRSLLPAFVQVSCSPWLALHIALGHPVLAGLVVLQAVEVEGWFAHTAESREREAQSYCPALPTPRHLAETSSTLHLTWVAESCLSLLVLG